MCDHSVPPSMCDSQLSAVRGVAGDDGQPVPPHPGNGADRPHQSQAEEEHCEGAEQEGEAEAREAGCQGLRGPVRQGDQAGPGLLP